MLHDNPGHLFRYETGIFDSGIPLTVTPMSADCPADCMYWVHQSIDTTAAPDGWFEARIKARVRYPNGDEQLTSSGWPINIQNGNPEGGQRPSMGGMVSRGWYENHGYQNPVVTNPAVFLAPLHGTASLGLRLDAGAGGFPTTYSAVLLDPDFHNADPSKRKGTILLERSGPTRTTYALDTTAIPDGTHRLVFISGATSGGQTNSGVMSVTVTVDN